MFETLPNARRCALLIAASVAALGCAAPAFGQATGQAAASESRGGASKPRLSDAKPTSPNATINLVHLLVKQGVLTEEQAAGLIKQADDEAYIARQAAKNASTRAEEAAKAANAAAAATEPNGTRHVTYVPEVVKRQLREDIKREVMAKAEQENWASPGKYPEWAQRIRFYGDIRLRHEGDYFPSGNGPLQSYNAINTGSPFLEGNGTVPNPYFPPTYNTSQNRDRFRFRARLGMDADIYEGFTAGLRIATGESGSPVSTNQSLGASSNGGNFSKYSLWLDRAYLKYQAWDDGLVLSGGRFDNPFWSPTDLVWYKDLGFDGFAVQAKYRVADGFKPFAVAGAFPIYNTDLNAGLNTFDPSISAPIKLRSANKWLFGGQLGFGAKVADDANLRVAVAYYDFENVQGRLSSVCQVVGTADSCDTDMLRPSFAQKGNTYMGLRSFQVISTGWADYQYYGLASQFRPVVATGQVDLATFHPVHVVLDGEYIWNSAFNRSAVAAVAVNNFGSSPAAGAPAPYVGGSTGWLARLTVGYNEIKKLGDWNVHAGYKYLQSDATIDAFVDSDFGLGGTNLKGYFIGGNVGISDNVWASLRWMSANSIAGVPYAVDVVQVDLNARF
ncbi:hypothetical protein S58_65240 [Bradyrhizobium oligotrophicum S58]|uniref:Porin n=1 Tax=Bradyrhizobium oligotrophicum S58 TaxID=1245469 RepID=M4ZF69_9BRAD|nr:putative porin [Bradyrhizobium oligotrophicum]BAM92497.1 hypothetical protein S58_65240 [Bradyrhizobium oligotrophicum S58]